MFRGQLRWPGVVNKKGGKGVGWEKVGCARYNIK